MTGKTMPWCAEQRLRWILIPGCLLVALTGCARDPVYPELPEARFVEPFTSTPQDYRYLIGPGDSLQIFVWRNPELSTGAIVRPDGFLTAPLVEDVQASGMTPTQLARQMEELLGVYVRDPLVTVIVNGFRGPYSEQVRVVGEAANPQAIPYREDMTLLDLMIVAGGTTEFAAGDKATLIRVIDGQQEQYALRIDSLIRDGDISANVDLLPGDIVIIPESWF